MSLKQKLCKHEWQDFPWYIKQTNYSFTVKEPYVCKKCHKLKVVELGTLNFNTNCEKEHAQQDFINRYADRIMEQPVVADLIHDAIMGVNHTELVDYLEIENNYLREEVKKYVE